MGGVKPQEIFYILLFALILLGPQRLPGIARKLGSWAAELRKAATDLRTGLEAEVGDLPQIGRELTQPMKDIKQELRAPLVQARSELEKPIMEMKAVGDSIKSGAAASPKSPAPVVAEAEEPPPVLRWIGPVPPGSEPATEALGAAPLRWVGPVPAAGPTAVDAAVDLAEIERSGQGLTDETGSVT